MSHPAWRLAVVPLLAAGIAQGFRWVFNPWMGPQATSVQMFSFLGVVVAAWRGGLWAGLVAMPLSIAAGLVAAVLGTGSLPALTAPEVSRITLFVLISIVFSALIESHLRSERRVTEEQKRLRLVADHINVMLVNVDREWRFKFANRAYAAYYGKTPEEVIGRHASELIAPEVLQNATPYIQRVLSGETVEFEITVPRPDAGPRTVRSAYVPEHDERGRVVGWVGAIRDITETRQAEAELKNFAFLVQNASDFIGISDLEHRPYFVNRAGRQLVGLPEAGALPDIRVFDFFFPEDLGYLRGEFFDRVLRDGHASTDVRFRHFTTGEPIWMTYSVVRMEDVAGQPTGYATISTNLTERKRTEDLERQMARDKDLALARLREVTERLRAALDASVTGTFQWNIETGALDWDDNLDRLFGLAPGSTARSLQEFIQLVHPDDRQRVIDACQRCADTGADFVEEFRVIWPDGSVRWLYDKGRVYTSDAGRRYMSGACVDVTERRQKEDALRAADRQKDEFLGMLAHEIRNPLAPMMYSVAVLERQIGDASARRPLEVIGRQVRRMVRIVDDLLDVSRVTQGKISLQRERVNMADLVTQAVESVRPAMVARNHALQVDTPGRSLIVSGDAVRLVQVLENLLVNAAKYTPEGGTVTVSLRREDNDAVIQVADTGVGIERDMLPRVFDLFAQADTSLDRAEGGLGIGLTLVDRLTRLHGGRVDVSSEGPGAGSTFTVRLPLLASDEPARADRPRGPAAQPKRILIVDDNTDSAESLGTLLQMNGHRVRLLHDGRAAVDGARSFAPDVILLDIGLPGLDGFQVVRQLKGAPDLASITVVATTGYGRAEDRARCLEAGFDHHLTKPIDLADIDGILANLPARQPSSDARGEVA